MNKTTLTFPQALFFLLLRLVVNEERMGAKMSIVICLFFTHLTLHELTNIVPGF